MNSDITLELNLHEVTNRKQFQAVLIAWVYVCFKQTQKE